MLTPGETLNLWKSLKERPWFLGGMKKIRAKRLNLNQDETCEKKKRIQQLSFLTQLCFAKPPAFSPQVVFMLLGGDPATVHKDLVAKFHWHIPNRALEHRTLHHTLEN